jgi:hypothetical protein
MFKVTQIQVVRLKSYCQDMVLMESDIPNNGIQDSESGTIEMVVKVELGKGMQFCKENFPNVPVKYLGG